MLLVTPFHFGVVRLEEGASLNAIEGRLLQERIGTDPRRSPELYSPKWIADCLNGTPGIEYCAVSLFHRLSGALRYTSYAIVSCNHSIVFEGCQDDLFARRRKRYWHSFRRKRRPIGGKFGFVLDDAS